MYAIIRSILFALSVGDAERAHILALKAMGAMQHVPPLLQLSAWYCQASKQQPVTHSGITFPNFVGLAAGLDKNGEVMAFLQAIGFGFLEIGSVLPRPQPGNPKPRMFRLPKHKALINRMGFNSEGADVVLENLERWKGTMKIPIGISLGKNLNTPPEAMAYAQDCILTLTKVRAHAAYAAINVSSPNTKGLRDLQIHENVRKLVHEIVKAERDLAQQHQDEPRPILVKFTADMDEGDMLDAAQVCRAEGAAGFIVSNTTLARPFDGQIPRHAGEIGGLSGPPLYARAVRAIGRLRAEDSKALLIGVGGIEGYETAQRMRDDGADLVQLYTSLVYQGPRVIRAARGLYRH